MPPFDKNSIQPMSVDEEPDALLEDALGKDVVSDNTPIRSCLRKEKENYGCFVMMTANKMKKTLQFHESISLLWIEPIDNMSQEEFDNCYYTAQDYIGFREREKRIARNFSNWGFMKSGRKGEYLGVESRLQRFHRRQRTKNAVFAVLLEQELRVETGPNTEDDLALARAYMQHTTESARLARERAEFNASLIGRIPHSLSDKNKSSMGEVEMDTYGEKKKTEMPWEVPSTSFNKTRSSKNGPGNLIKYSTCSYPVLPVEYSKALHCQQESNLSAQKSTQDFRCLYNNKFDEQGMLSANKSVDAPVEQKIVRPQQELYKFEQHGMIHSHSLQHPSTGGNIYAHPPVAQQWEWNQTVPRDAPVHPPTLLHYHHVY